MLLIVSSWITITPWVIDFWITPCQISKPASVTTNDGTPISATIEPWNAPITVPASDGEQDRDEPRYWWLLPASYSCATTTPATPLT